MDPRSAARLLGVFAVVYAAGFGAWSVACENDASTDGCVPQMRWTPVVQVLLLVVCLALLLRERAEWSAVVATVAIATTLFFLFTLDLVGFFAFQLMALAAFAEMYRLSRERKARARPEAR